MRDDMSERLREIFAMIERETGRWSTEAPPFVIGVNGMDCAGKTQFARSLADFLVRAGHEVELLQIDDYNDLTVQTQTYEAFRESRFTPAHLDRFYAGSIDYTRAAHAIWDPNRGPRLVVVEGVFLYKDELVGFIDYKIYLEVDSAVAEARYRARREAEGDPRPLAVFRDLWLPAHERYVLEREPQCHASLVIDNNDFENPRLRSDPSPEMP